ncbi:hypothetical protein TWF506_006655 [Arthrobotrys conoides]|uniref:MYND-type zinc finger protein samB n=1 Tax=Arthrobotrys conoides TaxID=74498 RepID=A0AAN8S1C2_9PEZI
MREVNFSIPNVNKASVGITTALYDRRALDCTSTLPLINSLNHLAYLTTSSARIRDILTVDGGVERLVCILKEGRSKDLMNMWKWNLAFQCVVNIGVRGSEDVRKRVVEADMVPVIATILDNYIQVMERYRMRNESGVRRGLGAGHNHNTAPSLRPREARASSASYFERTNERAGSTSTERAARRQPPPPSIEIPVPFPNALPNDHATLNSDSSVPLTAPTITADRPLRPHHHRSVSELRYHANFPQITSIAPTAAQGFPSGSNASQVADMSETFGFRPVRDADRLPSMLFGQGTASQPESPTTPNPLSTGVPAPISTGGTRMSRSTNRPSIRHARSMSDESDEIEANSDEVSSNISGGVESGNEPLVGIQSGVTVSIRSTEMLVETDDTPMTMDTQAGADGPDAETFNITHRSPIDGSIMDPSNDATETPGFSQLINRTSPNPMTIQPPTQLAGLVPNNPSSQQIVLPSMPREDDVLMSLQLLAYVSKYTYLRTYFQKSHLVPNLSINSEIHLLDEADGKTPVRAPEPPMEEYLVPDDFNIFPLVEKFTVRHHPQDMQYWAGVVMRNLCRKDDSRGGIRQCAYFQCGKWEEYTRQFAKCRRCRRTKYCSKDCQKNAWVYHRHWCVVAAQQ